jgi:hypothetical protein
LKKRTKKLFSRLGVASFRRHCELSAAPSVAPFVKQSSTFLASFSSSGRAANKHSDLKLTSLAPNRSQIDKSFFGSFFSKKELLSSLPLAFLPPIGAKLMSLS